MSSGSAATPSSAISSTMRSRSAGWPWPPPYCRAIDPCSSRTSLTTSRMSSEGRAWTYGMPPASETTSGREATAKSARTSEADMPEVRAA